MRYIKYLMKVVGAGIVSLIILCFIASVYSLSPMRAKNVNNNTDYVWESSSYWMKMTEGVSFGKVDGNGFNNKEVVENPDIILLGSSHIEGMNVNQDDHMCTLLNEKFSDKYSVYNMGISGHTFIKVVKYLENSIAVCESSVKYVVIETSTTNLTKDDVDKALNGQVDVTTVNNEGLVAKLQRLAFLRQAYHQLENGMMDMLLPQRSSDSVSDGVVINQNEVVIEEQPYEDIFSYLESIEEKYGVNIIVVYHPFEKLNKDGSISFDYADYTDVFAQYSKKHSIGFVDMTKEFERMYYEEHHVAHGFATGELGAGHINKYGHSTMAQSIYEFIIESEEVE